MNDQFLTNLSPFNPRPWSFLSGSRGIRFLLFLTPLLTVLTGCSTGQKADDFKELRKLSNDSAEEARDLRDAGNLNASVAKYQEALRYDPSPGTHKELGDVLSELKRYEEAKSHYTLALSKNPNMVEAEESLSRIDARIQLAGRSPTPSAASMRSKPGPRPASRIQEEWEDERYENEAFEEMARVRTPEQSESREWRRPGGSGADSLIADSEELFGSESFSRYEGDDYDAASGNVVRKAAVLPPGRKSLGGGRGLLPSGGPKPSIITVGGDSFPARTQLADSGGDRGLLRPPPSGRPGERRLAGGPRLPERAPRIGFEDPGAGPRGNRPQFATESGRSETRVEGPVPASDPDLIAESEERRGGWLEGFLGGGEDIVYPEPTAPEPPERLVSAYGEEAIDLTKWNTGRLKGRPEKTLDLETCKRRYYEEDDLDGAVRCFGDKRIDFPDNPTLYYELARVYQHAGAYPMAVQNFELAIKYAPDNYEYRQALAVSQVEHAQGMRKSGDLKGALTYLKSILDRYPDMVEVHRELAKVYVQDAQRLEAALPPAGQPAPPGTLETIEADWREAETVYDEVVRLSPDTYKDWYNLGLCVQMQNDDTKTTKAIRAYQRAVDLNPKYADAHYNLAVANESVSVQDSIDHYRQALVIARAQGDDGLPMVLKCLRDMGDLYFRNGDTEKAAEVLTEYIQYEPDDAHIEKILDQITSVPPPNG